MTQQLAAQKHRILPALMVVAAGLALSAWGMRADAQTATTTGMSGTAPTCALSVSPTTISSGQSASLSWVSQSVTIGSIDQGIGSVASASGGSMTVTPQVSTTYTGTFAGTSEASTGSGTSALYTGVASGIGTDSFTLTADDGTSYTVTTSATTQIRDQAGNTIPFSSIQSGDSIRLDGMLCSTGSIAATVVRDTSIGGTGSGGSSPGAATGTGTTSGTEIPGASSGATDGSGTGGSGTGAGGTGTGTGGTGTSSTGSGTSSGSFPFF